MIDFKSVELRDKPWVDELLKSERSGSADYSFANIFLWDHIYHQQLAQVDERLVIMPCCGPAPFFCYPVGTGDIAPVIAQLREYAAAHEFPFVLRGVTNNHRAELESTFPGQLDFEPQRNYFDYIYDAKHLANLEGKKYSAKRNHINYFENNYRWQFLPITDRFCSDCEVLLDEWLKWQHPDDGYAGLEGEHFAIKLALRHVKDLGLDGGVLYADNKPVAFTLGERISELVYNVHFEKAYPAVRGAYPTVNREFVRYILQKYPQVRYINREDDMGLENLRRAKLSYHPDFLLEKYNVTWR